jgi:hypothetical protein
MAQLLGYPVYPEGTVSSTTTINNGLAYTTGSYAGYTTVTYGTGSYGIMPQQWVADGNFNNSIEEKKPMVKYYKVVKDHPVYEIGCILEKSGDFYRPVTPEFTKDFPARTVDSEAWGEDVILVEDSDWFERVYKVDSKESISYLSKADAQAAATAATTTTTPAA